LFDTNIPVRYFEKINVMKNYPTWKKNPRLLTAHEIAIPTDAMQEFFWSYDMEEIRSHCWNWLVTSVQDEDTNAGNAVLFYENLMKFIEAAHIFINAESSINRG
jgi:hypothetical protein